MTKKIYWAAAIYTIAGRQRQARGGRSAARAAPGPKRQEALR